MKKHIIATLALALTAANSTQAVPVFDTLALTPTGTNYFKGPIGFLPYAELGFVFQVPTTSDYLLDALTFSFNTGTNVTVPLELAAFSIGTGTPQGTLLTTFSGPLFPVSTLGTYTPDSALSLPAGSEVFFRLKVPTSSTLYRVDNTNTSLPSSDWTFAQTYIGNSFGNWTPNVNAPIMQISATAVPEPGTATLLLASALMLVRRRR
jgi:hypothetical protein